MKTCSSNFRFSSVFICVHLWLVFSALGVNAAAAQTYPAKSIRIVVPFPPGGGTDLVARTVAQKMHETLGQTAIVDNRAGANGIIGADLVAKAPADGYTVLITIASHTINPTLYSKLPYDTLGDLAPVSLLAEYPFVITVHPSVPAKTIRELIAFAKSHPGQLSYASSGNGSGPHLGMELFKSMAGIDMVHVPYKGAGQAMTDLVSGQVQVFLNNFLAGMAMIKAGKLRALAVTSQQRSPVAPELPTVAEAGVPGYVVTGWYGMFVPAATPAPVVATLHAGVVKAIKAKEVSDRLSNEAAVIVGSTPRQFGEFLKAEIAKWAAVIRKAQIKPEALQRGVSSADFRALDRMVDAVREFHHVLAQHGQVGIANAVPGEAIDGLIKIISARAEPAFGGRERLDDRLDRQLAGVMRMRVIDDECDRADFPGDCVGGDPARRV